MEAGLPQHGVVKEAFHDNEFLALTNLLPRIQAALTAREESVRGCVSDTAAIKVTFQREDDAVGIGVVAVGIHQTHLAQYCGRITQLAQPCPKTTARRIT